MKYCGTDRCCINSQGNPDNVVGMRPRYGGNGKSIEKYKQCN